MMMMMFLMVVVVMILVAVIIVGDFNFDGGDDTDFVNVSNEDDVSLHLCACEMLKK